MTRFIAILLLLFSAHGYAATDQRTAQALQTALAGNHRSAAHKARDQYRHPAATLAFFGLKDDQTVVEIWPSEGWYTEILAPVLRDHGQFYAASFAEQNPETKAFRRDMALDFRAKLAAQPTLYDHVKVTALQAPQQGEIAPPNSADLILTFRSVHNWLKDGNADAVFSAMFKASKPGGTLGVVDHRAKPGTSLEQMAKTGYVTEAEVIALATNAGYKLQDRSEVNANPLDTKDYAVGVWALPPILRGNSADKQPYMAIGESDRMTLKFIKPKT